MLNMQCNLQHLDVKPRNLFLVGNHVKVADFGLVQSLTLNQAEQSAGRHHAALRRAGTVPGQDQPALRSVQPGHRLSGTADRHAAVRRQEYPAAAAAAHQARAESARPCRAEDRAIVARPCTRTPNHRFACCLDFVRALLAEGAPSPRVREAGRSVWIRREISTGRNAAAAAGQRTESWRGHATPSLPAGVLPGHRFIECLVNSPLIETWKATHAERQARNWCTSSMAAR